MHPFDAETETVYLDHNATTPLDPEVLEAMRPWMGPACNPHSLHSAGRRAAAAVERAREQVASLVGAEPDEVVLTSGATEANNLAIVGTVRGARRGSAPPGVVTTAIEHRAVLDVCEGLARAGEARVAYVAVSAGGRVDVDAFDRVLRTERATLVSVAAVNNEIGVIQPVASLGGRCAAAGALFHVDAAQAAGRIDIDVARDGIDLLSISGHKLYGPMGIGALIVAASAAGHLEPLMRGGGQQRGLRPGTVPVPLAVGLGEACTRAAEQRAQDEANAASARDAFLGELRRRGVRFVLQGDPRHRVAGNLNLRFPGCDAEIVMVDCPDVLCSVGSACTSGLLEPSHVLLAIGISREEADSSLRFGFGRQTTVAEATLAAGRIAAAVARQLAAGEPTVAA